jgi:fatty acid amide hydrolase
MKLHQLDATALLAALAKGETSSVEIVSALIERRRAVGDKVGAIVLPLDDSARKAAEAADAARRRGDPIGPLHGLPMTIKDNFEVIGTPATLGVTNRRSHHSQKDAVTVAALKAAGSIVLGKTNVPQLLLVQESDNAIYGTTNNPVEPGQRVRADRQEEKGPRLRPVSHRSGSARTSAARSASRPTSAASLD